MPSITELCLSLNGTNISDTSIRNLVQKTLSSAENLRTLRICLSKTEITQDGLRQLFHNKSCTLKSLSLELAYFSNIQDVYKELSNSFSKMPPLTHLSLTLSDNRIGNLALPLQHIKSSLKSLHLAFIESNQDQFYVGNSQIKGFLSLDQLDSLKLEFTN